MPNGERVYTAACPRSKNIIQIAVIVEYIILKHPTPNSNSVTELTGVRLTPHVKHTRVYSGMYDFTRVNISSANSTALLQVEVEEHAQFSTVVGYAFASFVMWRGAMCFVQVALHVSQ
jgi:hypothetical protein